jgi:hypothetical protein
MFVVNFSTTSSVGNVIVYDPATDDPNPLAVITKGIYSPNGTASTEAVPYTWEMTLGAQAGSRSMQQAQQNRLRP